MKMITRNDPFPPVLLISVSLLWGLLHLIIPEPAQAKMDSTFIDSKHTAGPPLANPRTPINHLKFFGFEDDSSDETQLLGSEAALTHNFLASEWDSRAGKWYFFCEAGVFSQFQESPDDFELVSSDFYFGLPLELDRGDRSWRFELYHLSSHLGDEFSERTGRDRISFSQESLRVLHYWKLSPKQRFYLGIEEALSITPDVGTTTYETGFDYRFLESWYAGANVRSRERNDYDPSITTQLMRRFDSKGFSFGIEFFDGPLPVGQFFREERTYGGIVFQFDQ